MRSSLCPAELVDELVADDLILLKYIFFRNVDKKTVLRSTSYITSLKGKDENRSKLGQPMLPDLAF